MYSFGGNFKINKSIAINFLTDKKILKERVYFHACKFQVEMLLCDASFSFMQIYTDVCIPALRK